MKNLSVSVIIPNFNGESLLEKNLPFVMKATENPQNHVVEVIVVDDGSRDNSVKTIISKFPQVKLIKHKINRGFPASINTGIRAAKGDLMCVLNSDILPENNFLESVFLDFQNSKVFGVSLDEAGDFGWTKASFVDGFIEYTAGSKSLTPHNTFWVNGGNGVFRRSIWMELGGMDEKILSPFYWEDVDLCYRALKRGYTLIWEPGAKVTHMNEDTMNHFPKARPQKIMENNQLLFIWKNLTSTNLFRKHVMGLLKRLANHPGYVKIVLIALGKTGLVIKARKKEKKEAKISDETIFSRF